MSCPARTEKNNRDCLKVTRHHFSWGQVPGQQEVGIRLYRHIASTKFPDERVFQFGDTGPQSFCGFRHIHCLARVMPGGCVKYRMHGTHCHQCHAREDEHQSILSPLVNAFPSPVSTSRIKSRSTPVSTCHQRSYQCKYRCNLRTSNATLAAELIPKPGAVRIVSCGSCWSSSCLQRYGRAFRKDRQP